MRKTSALFIKASNGQDKALFQLDPLDGTNWQPLIGQAKFAWIDHS